MCVKCRRLEQIQWQNAAPPSDENARMALQLKEEHVRMLDEFNKQLLQVCLPSAGSCIGARC
jgi:hypothetical protein